MTLKKIRPTKDQWDRYLDSNASRRRKSKWLRDLHLAVQEIRQRRAAARLVNDKLTVPAWHRLKAQRDLARLASERCARDKRDVRRAREEERRREIRRQNLMIFGRAARGLGLEVRASMARCSNRVSSYYISRLGELGKVRVSDHHLHMTQARQIADNIYGASPFIGEIIVDDDPIAITRARRLIILAMAGRA